MINHIPSFDQFLNEESLPFSMEEMKLNELSWKPDEEASSELKKKIKEATDAHVLVAKDEKRDRKYIFKTWMTDQDLHISLTEDGKKVFRENYYIEDKRYYDSDCINIIGKKIK